MDNPLQLYTQLDDDPLLRTATEASSEALSSSSAVANASDNVAQPSTASARLAASCNENPASNQPSDTGAEWSAWNSNQAGTGTQDGAGSGRSTLSEPPDCLVSYWQQTSLRADEECVKEAKRLFAVLVNRDYIARRVRDHARNLDERDTTLNDLEKQDRERQRQFSQLEHNLQALQIDEWMYATLNYVKFLESLQNKVHHITIHSGHFIRSREGEIIPFRYHVRGSVKHRGIYLFLQVPDVLTYEYALLLYVHFMGKCVLKDFYAGLGRTPEGLFWRLTWYFVGSPGYHSNTPSEITLGPDRAGLWSFSHLDETCRDMPHEKPFVTFTFSFRSFKTRSDFVRREHKEPDSTGCPHEDNPEDQAPAAGFELTRDACEIPYLCDYKAEPIHQIREGRYVSAMKFYPDRQSPCFSIITMSDINRSPQTYRRFSEKDEVYQFPLAPVIIYLDTLLEALRLAACNFDEVLRLVESENEIQLSSLTKNCSVSQMMFDGDFKRSTFYFKMLQILRVLDSGLNDMQIAIDSMPMLWLDTLHRRFLNVYCPQADIDEVRIYWEELRWTATLQYFGTLKQRIQAKKSEVESLRDGLFNATSVREALQARHTNQSILIFTFVTIVYLPLSFVTSLFSMNNIPSDSAMLTTVVPFIILIVSIASITYLSAFLAQDWYSFRKSGTGSTWKAWRDRKKRLCKDIWNEFLISIRLRNPPDQSWRSEPMGLPFY